MEVRREDKGGASVSLPSINDNKFLARAVSPKVSAIDYSYPQ